MVTTSLNAWQREESGSKYSDVNKGMIPSTNILREVRMRNIFIGQEISWGERACQTSTAEGRGEKMRQRKFKFLLVALLVVSGLMFAGGEARASFSSFNYSIEQTPAFPNPNPTPSAGTYVYVFTPIGQSQTTVKNISFEIPVEITNQNILSSKMAIKYKKAGATAFVTLSYSLLENGDTDTRFGVDDNRYKVVRINPPGTGFDKSFTLSIELTGITLAPLGPIKRGLGARIQVWELKAGQSTSDSTTVASPTPVDISTDQPTVSLVSKSTGTQVGKVDPGGCDSLMWTAGFGTSGAGSSVMISSVPPGAGGLVAQGGNPGSGELPVCPKSTTIYRITASTAADHTRSPAGPLTATESVTINIGDEPPPELDLAMKTYVKADEFNNQFNLTYYVVENAPVCSCKTPLAAPILEYPCATIPLPAACTLAYEQPVLVCIPFPGISEADLMATCDPDLLNCRVVPITPCLGGGCFSRCDELKSTSSAISFVVGPKSCTCETTTKKKLIGGKWVDVPVTTCTGTPCP